MTIEEEIFKRFSPDFKKLEKYGFKKVPEEKGSKKSFKIEKLFKDNLFKAEISVSFEGKVSGTVYDLENDDEFLPLRVETGAGAFVGEIRAFYEEILKDIREKCFVKKYFVFPQSNRIANLVIEKYGDNPEFLWEKFTGTAVFRNPESKKWYLAILDVERVKVVGSEKLSKGGAKAKGVGNSTAKDIVEVADFKLSEDNIQKLLSKKGFYPGYHMNKKSWITVILDDSLPDEKIMELIEESHSFTIKKPKKG